MHMTSTMSSEELSFNTAGARKKDKKEKKGKLDERGNPVKKVKVDENGNPIKKKKKGHQESEEVNPVGTFLGRKSNVSPRDEDEGMDKSNSFRRRSTAIHDSEGGSTSGKSLGRKSNATVHNDDDGRSRSKSSRRQSSASLTRKSNSARKMEDENLSSPIQTDEHLFNSDRRMKKEHSAGMLQLKAPGMMTEAPVPQHGHATRRGSLTSNVPNLSAIMAAEVMSDRIVEPDTRSDDEPKVEPEEDSEAPVVQSGRAMRRGSITSTVPNLGALMAAEAPVRDSMEPDLMDQGDSFPSINKSNNMSSVVKREIAQKASWNSAGDDFGEKEGSISSFRSRDSDRKMEASLNRLRDENSHAAATSGKESHSSMARTTEFSDVTTRPGAISVSSAAPKGKGFGSSVSQSGNATRLGAVSVSTPAPAGKGSGPSFLRGSNHHGEPSSRVGAISVPTPATEKGSGPSHSRGSNNNGGATSRVGAVSVPTAAPAGKGFGSSLGRGSPSNDVGASRVGAVSVPTAAPGGKGSGPSMGRGSDNNGGATSRVGAVSVPTAAPAGKGSGPSLVRGTESYGGGAGRVGAVSVPTAAPAGKGSGPSMGRRSDNNDTGASRVGAVSVPTAAPAGKGSGPSLARGAESYDGGAGRVGAVSVPTAAPAGKGSGPAHARVAVSYNDTTGHVGAVSVASAAPEGKGRRHSGGATGVGAVMVASAAPVGKGTSRPSVAITAESYGETNRQGAVSVATAAPSGKGSSSRFSAPSQNGSETPSQGDRARIGAMTMNTSVPQGKESGTAVFSAPDSPTKQKKGSFRGTNQTNEKSRIGHHPSASTPGVSGAGPSHFPSNAETYEEGLRSEKTGIGHFPTSETYARDLNEHTSHAAARRKADDANIGGGGARRGSAHTIQSENDTSTGKSCPFGDGPVHANSAESYDGSASLRSESFSRLSYRGLDALTLEEDDTGLEQRPYGVGDYGNDVRLEAEPGVAFVGTEDLKESWYCTIRFRMLVFALFFCGSGAGIAMALTSTQNNGPAVTPAPSPPLIDKSRQDSIRLVCTGITNMNVIDNTTTAQYAAYDWLVRYDTFSTISPSGLTEEERSRILIRYGLATLYYATNGDGWFSSQNWLDPVEACQWQHLTCVNDDIISISTGERNNLAGSLPSELRTLSSLRELNLANNALTSITPDIGLLSNLINLDLNSNEIEGSIPASIFSLSLLSLWDLGSNKFTGTLSTLVAEMPSLGRLSLLDNLLTGKLTTELQSMSRLNELDVKQNQLSGNLQQILSGLSGLTVIAMAENLFTGTLDSSLLQFQEIIEVDFGGLNLLESTIPTEMGNMSTIEAIFLYGAGVIGTIPSELGKLMQLAILYLQDNKISGAVPAEICAAVSLTDMRVDCRLNCQCDVCSQTVTACGSASRRLLNLRGLQAITDNFVDESV